MRVSILVYLRITVQHSNSLFLPDPDTLYDDGQDYNTVMYMSSLFVSQNSDIDEKKPFGIF